MAFQLPGLPNLNVNIPQQPDPLQKAGQFASLQSMLGENALRQQLAPLNVQEAQQRAQQAQIQTQQQQLELDSQKNLMKAISSGAFNKYAGVQTSDGTGFDGAGAYQDLVKTYNVLPQHAQQAVSSLQTIAKNAADISKTTAQAGEANQNIRIKTLDQLAQKFGSINEMSIDKAGPALEALKQDVVKNRNAYPGLTQQELAQIYSSTLEHLPAMESLLGIEGKIADFHKSKSEATTAAQSVIPPGGGLSPATQQQVAKDVAVNTNPQIQQGKEAVAAAEGAARAAVEAQVARGSNAALKDVPPHMVAPATEAATKAGTEYAQAKSVSDRLAAMMDAAKNGNVVSYQLIPQEGALQVTTSQGVHRINMAEIQNYGGGSIFQRLEGHLGKALTGKSIPDSVLSDMAEMQKIQSEGSQTKYENTLKTINQAYGANFKPVEMASSGKNSAPPAIPAAVTKVLEKAGTGRHTLSDKSVWDKLPDGTIQKVGTP